MRNASGALWRGRPVQRPRFTADLVLVARIAVPGQRVSAVSISSQRVKKTIWPSPGQMGALPAAVLRRGIAYRELMVRWIGNLLGELELLGQHRDAGQAQVMVEGEDGIDVATRLDEGD